MQLRIKKLHEDAKIPEFQNAGDAGMDLYALGDYEIDFGHRVLVKTGVSMEIPEGYAGFIQPRSGLALKQGITIINTPGLIDSGYRGEIMVAMINLDFTGVGKAKVLSGDRVAQMVIQKVEIPEIIEADALSDTERGEGGFGSTGVK